MAGQEVIQVHSDKPVFHAPRPGHRATWAGILLAGATATAVIASNINAVGRVKPQTEQLPRPGTADPEKMEHPLGEYLTLSVSPTGEIVIEKFTKEPETLKAVSFNVEEGELVNFQNSDPDNPQSFSVSPDSLRDSSFVAVFGKGDKDFALAPDNIPHGDIWLIRTNENGEPLGQDGQILPPGESPFMTQIGGVSLAIPFQAPSRA
mgnify:CR=1 FL=1